MNCVQEQSDETTINFGHSLSNKSGEGFLFALKRAVVCIAVSVSILAGFNPVIASDPAQSGWATFYGTNPMVLHWNVEISALLRTSLINSNGVVTVCVSGGYDILCIDNATGQLLWKARSPNQLSGAPEISGAHGCVITSTELGEVTGYSIKNGEKIFNISTGWPKTSQPILSEKYLLVRGYDQSKLRSGIIAINISKASIAWKVGSGFSVQPPTASNCKVFVLEDNKVRAINESTGLVVWERQIGFSGEFVSSRGKELCVAGGTNVSILNTEDGNQSGGFELDSPACFSLSLDGGLCYAVTGKGMVLSCLDVATGKKLWSVESQTPYFKPWAWKDGVIAPSASCVQTIDRLTGKLMWDISAIGLLVTEPIAINDYMIVATSQKLYAFRNSGFEIQIGSDQLDLGIMTHEAPFGTSKVQVFNFSGSRLEVSCQSLNPWLVATPDRFEIGPHDAVDVSLSADMRTVDDGLYSGKLKVNWQNGSRDVIVAARKMKPEEKDPPKPGVLYIKNTYVDFSARLGQPHQVFQIILENQGDLETDYSLSSISPWIMVSGKNGILRGRASVNVNVCLVTEQAIMGLNETIITIKSKSLDSSIEFYVRFWRDKGVLSKVCEFDLGSSVATITGVKVRARPEPHLKNNIFMLPLNFIHLMLDCRMEQINDKTYRLSRDNVSMILEIDSPTCEVFTPKGLKKLKLDAPVSLRSGLVAVPVTVLEEAYETRLTNKGNHYILEVKLPEID